MTGPYADDLSLALSLADEVDALTLAGFGNASIRVETKPDLTPVTEIDRTAEDLIRTLLEKTLPDDSVYGEEFGTKGGGPRQWVIDPVDGTKNFIRGIPVWATLIALLVEGDPVMGVVSAPALGERWFASRGDGAWKGRNRKNAKRLRVSGIESLSEATLSYSDLTGWEAAGSLNRFLDLQRKMWRTRAFGDFWSYMLVAEGVVEAATEPSLELYDMAALVPIVEEAGGRFTSLAGVRGPFGVDALATNGVLHDDVLRLLGQDLPGAV
ncbi:MAG: histidinol-phosphatase [Demequinaceae bacterium]|nr:histidinol-phosphatase [Demequinaceae bacterium]